MMVKLKDLLLSEPPDEDLEKTIVEMENEQDTMQHEIVTFMSNLLVGNVPHEVVDEARRQLRMADEYESVSDCIASVLKAHRHLRRHDMQLPKDQQAELLELHEMVANYLTLVSQCYTESQEQNATSDLIAHGETITKHAKRLNKRLLSRAPEEQLQPRASISYNRAVAAYRRIRDHLVNITEALAGEK